MWVASHRKSEFGNRPSHWWNTAVGTPHAFPGRAGLEAGAWPSAARALAPDWVAGSAHVAKAASRPSQSGERVSRWVIAVLTGPRQMMSCAENAQTAAPETTRRPYLKPPPDSAIPAWFLGVCFRQGRENRLERRKDCRSKAPNQHTLFRPMMSLGENAGKSCKTNDGTCRPMILPGGVAGAAPPAAPPRRLPRLDSPPSPA